MIHFNAQIESSFLDLFRHSLYFYLRSTYLI